MNDSSYWFRSTPGDPAKHPRNDPTGEAMTGEGYPTTDNAAWLMKWMARHGFALTLAALAELAHRMDELRDGAAQADAMRAQIEAIQNGLRHCIRSNDAAAFCCKHSELTKRQELPE